MAFGSNGTFAITWTELFPPIGMIAHTRRFSASPGPEFCIFRNGVFSCDTGRTGEIAEVRHPFGGDPGDIGLLGDVDGDGDGRADPCLFRAGLFLCDVHHDGSVGLTIPFGRPGDIPLLADFDGDGIAKPCVYRGQELLCRSGQKGGSVQTILTFGDGSGTPLVGNLDGL